MKSNTGRARIRFEDPLSYLARGISRLYSWWICAIYPFASRGSGLTVHFPFRLSRRGADQISLGNSITIGKDAWLNTVGEAFADAKIVIGDNCNIGARDIFSAKNSIKIESDVMIATAVLIQDHHHAYEDITAPISHQGVTDGGTIRIGQGCWIGQGAAIVCNEGELVIGANSVIGSNALVTRSFPPNSVIVGNPARLARQFNPARGAWIGGEAGRTGTPDTLRKSVDGNGIQALQTGVQVAE
jgi:acetyltransferase-like isoleucine patch superfamily enzyme